MKLNWLKLITILTLLLNSKNLLGQNDTIPINVVKDSLVTVPISYIKQANIKLAEGKYYKELSQQQDDLIFSLKELSNAKTDEIDKLRVDMFKLEQDVTNYEQLNASLDAALYKSKRRNIIFGSVALTSTIVAVISILVK